MISGIRRGVVCLGIYTPQVWGTQCSSISSRRLSTTKLYCHGRCVVISLLPVASLWASAPPAGRFHWGQLPGSGRWLEQGQEHPSEPAAPCTNSYCVPPFPPDFSKKKKKTKGSFLVLTDFHKGIRMADFICFHSVGQYSSSHYHMGKWSSSN